MEHMNMKINGEAPPVKTKCTTWRKKTKLERYLIVICIAITIAFLVMIGVVLYLEHMYTRPKVPVCNTAVCRAQAGQIMSYMDFDVDPCEDFYNFSCGSFSKVKSLPDHLNRYVSFVIAKEYIHRISKELLEENGESDEPDFVKQTKLFYKSCLEHDTETSDIIRQILNITGLYHWPILEHDDYNTDQLVEKALSIVDVHGGVNPYYQLYSEYNDTLLELEIYPGHTFEKEGILLNDTDETYIRGKEKYRNLLIYSFFKADLLLEAIDSEVDELLRFETLFANITSNIEEENSTETTLKELADECKEMGWKDIIKHTFDYFGHTNDYYDEIPLKISNKGYIENMCKLFGSNSKRTIYNYLVWRFVALNLRKFDSYFDKSTVEIMSNDDYLPIPKSLSCFNAIHYGIFHHALNYLVINHLQPDKSIEEVKEYEQEIKQEMDHMFSVESWLDEESRSISRKRLWNISGEIGYSKNSLDVGMLEKFFSQVNVSDNHIENHLHGEILRKRMALFNDSMTLRYEIKITDPLSISAYFMGDSFVITVGIMQPPFHAPGAPKYINYAKLAYIIGHELSHAYDSLDYDYKEGNLTEKWPEEIIEKFKEREQCYVNQYSQYPLNDNGTMVDGNFTIRDNIADNSGLFQAFAAYEKNHAKKEEPRLPGLDYTPLQMFFISSAQLWCEIVKDEEKVFKHDSHSPGRYRVIGPLQNFPRFSEVYNCPVGSPMNPKDKCRMWG